jgi:serine/threonine-protein kinase
MKQQIDVLCPYCRSPNRITANFCQACGKDIILNNDQPGDDDRRYSITRVIKAGGQGAVYEGIDQHGMVYAIKEMHDHFTDPQERQDALRYFNAEAELLQSLSHPRIPRVFSHFTDEGGHYLTMELVQGEDLEEIIEREGVIPEPQVLFWADQICDVLHYLHTQGLVYRDMKPSNVMIDQDGNVKLVDFGIAKVFVPNQRGTLIGTPGYSPPEQYQGLVTVASDIYALGATLHHMLTGSDPTQQTPFSFAPVRNLNVKVSQRTSEAIDRALQMRPEDRFNTVVEFRSMLRPLPGSQSGVLQASPASTVNLSARATAQSSPPGNQPVASSPPQAAPSAGATSGSFAAQSVSAAPPATHQQQASSRSAPRKPRSRCLPRLLWTVGIVFILAVVGLSLGFFLVRPVLTQDPLLDRSTPTIASPPSTPGKPLPGGFISFELEVVVSQDADQDTIEAAFHDALETLVQEEYGADVLLNKSFTTFVATGEPEYPRWIPVREENNQVYYHATMETLLYRE